MSPGARIGLGGHGHAAGRCVVRCSRQRAQVQAGVADGRMLVVRRRVSGGPSGCS